MPSRKAPNQSKVLQAGFNLVNEIKPIPMDLGPKVVNAYAVYTNLWHPFQKRMIPFNEPVPVIYDNWLKAQIEAKLIKELVSD